MAAGYSGTPLAKKLGVRAGTEVTTIDAPSHYLELLSPLPEGVSFQDCLSVGASFVHVFATERARLGKYLSAIRKLLARDGTVWVSWPKKAAKVPTDLDGNVVRELGLGVGLVDVKVCAVDEVWSGLKFVFRLADR